MNYKYNAFISYAHADSPATARLIQDSIENMGKPWYRLSRNLTLYRDETSLSAGTGLWENIEMALKQSEYLILLASNAAGQSGYVGTELSAWLEINGTDAGLKRLIVILVDGEMVWNPETIDFDWSRTTALPTKLTDMFTTEPLWVNLKPFIVKKNQTVILKNKIDKDALIAKVVGRLTNREPRDVESRELSRKRTIWSVVSAGLLFFTVAVIFAYFMFRQREFEKMVSRSNTLIAAGNALKDTDISRSLVYFAYAYDLNPIEANFNLVESHYNANIVSYGEEYSDSIHLNCFFSKLKLAENPANYENEGYGDLSRLHISLPSRRITSVLNGEMWLQDLNGKLLRKFQLPFVPTAEAPGSGSDGKLYFLTGKPHASVVSFDPGLQLFKVLIAPDSIQGIEAAYRPDVLEMLLDSSYDNIRLSSGGRYLVVYKSLASGKSNSKLLMLRLSDGKTSVVSLKEPTDMQEPLFLDEDVLLSDDGKKIVRVNKGNNNFTRDFLIYDVQSGVCSTDFFQADNWGDDTNNEPTALQWSEGHRFLLYGTVGGRLALAKSDGENEARADDNSYMEKVFSTPEKHIGTIMAVGYSKDFLFGGTYKGAVHIFRNGGNENFSHATHASGFPNLANIQLPTTGGIQELSFDSLNKVLSIHTTHGELYQLATAKFIGKLKKDPKALVKQLVLKLGLNDLSLAEKRKYKIF